MELSLIDTLVAVLIVIAWNGYLVYKWQKDDK